MGMTRSEAEAARAAMNAGLIAKSLPLEQAARIFAAWRDKDAAVKPPFDMAEWQTPAVHTLAGMIKAGFAPLRDAVGVSGGADPRIAAIEARWPGLLARLG